MFVSIIIPVYKVEKFIHACLTSVVEQDYEHLEIIIVDDCSPDNSISIAKSILECSGKRYRIVTYEKNRGLSGARNFGITEAAGDAIYFIDSDDRMHSNTVISEMVRTMKETGSNLVSGNYQRIYPNSINVSKYDKAVTYDGKENLIQAFCNGDIPITAWNKLIKMSFLQEHNLFFKEGLIHEDELWSFDTIIAANTIALTGNVTYDYYMHEGSIMTAKQSKRLESSIEIYHEMAISYITKCKMQNILSSHLNRYAFLRNIEIMSLRETHATKRRLYSKLRKYQKDLHIKKDLKDSIMHIHLKFPDKIGFWCMRTISCLYNWFRKHK